jgi:hypothetical protein
MTYTIASPSDFGQAEEVQLPSQAGTDKAVLLRRPDVIDLIASDGNVPDLLSDLVMRGVNGGEQVELGITKENLPDIGKTLDIVAKACFVQPKLWDNAEADGEHIPVKWLTFQDKSFVFAWALGGEYQSAKSFRDEPDAGMDAVPSSNGAAHKSKSKAGAAT